MTDNAPDTYIQHVHVNWLYIYVTLLERSRCEKTPIDSNIDFILTWDFFLSKENDNDNFKCRSGGASYLRAKLMFKTTAINSHNYLDVVHYPVIFVVADYFSQDKRKADAVPRRGETLMR